MFLLSFFRTAAPLPAPFQNPETKYRNWFHGTRSDFSNEDDDDTPGGRIEHQYTESLDHGANKERHWNNDLGSHFTSEHGTAEHFARGGPSGGLWPGSRIAHVSLHMANPKHFNSEFDMSRDAIKWAQSQGHHYYSEATRNDPGTEDHFRNYDLPGELPHEQEEDGFPSVRLSHLHEWNPDKQIKHLQIDRGEHLEDDAVKGIHGQDWDEHLAHHPEREEITQGYKNHLRSLGHDGVIYGNEYEGSRLHPCAIPFDDEQVNMHRWEWLDPKAHEKNTGQQQPEREHPDQQHLLHPTYFPGQGHYWEGHEQQHLGPMHSLLLQHFASGTPLYSQPEPKYQPAPEGLSDDEQMEHYENQRHIKDRWTREVRRAISRGDLHPDQARANGYHGEGHDQDSMGNLTWTHMPGTLWHVTTNKAGVLASNTLKSRHELNQAHGGSGLGGGPADTISFTDDLDTAHHIHRALHEYHSMLHDPEGIKKMRAEAYAGGYGETVDKTEHGSVRHAQAAEEGRKVVGTPIDGLMTEEQGRAKYGPEARFHEPMVMTHPSTGERLSSSFEVPMTPEERLEKTSAHYKTHVAHRSWNGGPMDPGFIMNSPHAMHEADPSQFGIVRVHPKPGSRGYKVSALGEWRTADGSVAHIGGMEPSQHDSDPQPPARTASLSASAVLVAEGLPRPLLGRSPEDSLGGGVQRGHEVVGRAVSVDLPHQIRSDDRVQPQRALSAELHVGVALGRISPAIDASRVGDIPLLKKRSDSIENQRIAVVDADLDVRGSVIGARHGDASFAIHDSREPGGIGISVHSIHSTEGYLENPYLGGENSHQWFHGTVGDFEGAPSPTAAADLHEERSRHSKGMGGPQPNKLLGTHWSALHSVAHGFAKGYKQSRIFHANLSMQSPKHFEDESAIMHHMWRWASSHPEFHDEQHNDNMAFNYGQGATSHGIDRRLASMDQADRTGERRPSHERDDIAHSMEQYIQFHPQQVGIAKGYVQHLKDIGYDGITYGNAVEGPRHHVSAITFDPEQAHITSVDRMHPEDKAHWNNGVRTTTPAEKQPGEVSHDHIASIHDEPQGLLDEVERYHNGGKNRATADDWYSGSGRNTGRGEYKYSSRAIPCDLCDGEGQRTRPDGSKFACDRCDGTGTFHAADHWDPPTLPEHQQAALDMPGSGSRDHERRSRALLDIAKNPQPGTMIYRGEIRHKDDLDRPPSVGMHWSVNPSSTILGHDVPEDHRPVLWEARLDNPETQAIPRNHPIWSGIHRSLDNEAEVRLRPGSNIHITRAFVHDGEGKRGYGPVPTHSERSTAAWSARPVGHDVPVAHKPSEKGSYAIDYSGVGIKHEGSHVLDSWEPKERLFAPTKGTVDPMLFDEQRKMYPAIRAEVLDVVNQFYRRHGYGSPKRWARVYLAGSQASEWWGNRDFDILIGINYQRFRETHPDLAHLSDADIGKQMNAGFAADFNDEDWHPKFDPEHDWHRTGYVNKDSWDIRQIKPYAAYNITDDVWAVDPIDEPTGHQFGPTEWYYFEAIAEEARQALALPEPKRSARASLIWEFVHSDRSRAFGPHGSGAFDRGNALEKYLDQADSGIPGKSLMAALADARFGRTANA